MTHSDDKKSKALTTLPGEDQDYEVGYAKPPVSTRFQKGKSGNPKGRPKGSKNLSTLFTEALDEPIDVKEKGVVRSMSKRKAMFTAIINKALTGDTRAAALVITNIKELEPQEKDEPIQVFIQRFGGSLRDEADK